MIRRREEGRYYIIINDMIHGNMVSERIATQVARTGNRIRGRRIERHICLILLYGDKHGPGDGEQWDGPSPEIWVVLGRWCMLP